MGDGSCREPIGSCVAISAALLPEHFQNVPRAGATPVLITHGEQDREVPRAAVSSSVELLSRAGGQASLICHAHTFLAVCNHGHFLSLAVDHAAN